MRDDPTEALPPRRKSLRILVAEGHATTLRVLARLLDHFGMNIRSLFVAAPSFCSRARRLRCRLLSGHEETEKRSSGMIHLNVARRQHGPASATRMDSPLALVLTWYQVEPTIVTGSTFRMPEDTRSSSTVIQAKWCTANSKEMSLTSMPMEKDCKRPLLMEVSGRQSGTFRQPHKKPRLQSHNRRPAWRRNRRRPERRSNKPANLMPKQSHQYQPHWLYRRRR